MMEAAKRRKTEELSGKAAYDALVDKKHCPKCGAQQKYDEVREKKKECPACKAVYRYKVDWARVSKEFFDTNNVAVKKAFVVKVNPEDELKRAEYDVKHISAKIRDDYLRAISVAEGERQALEAEQRMRHINLTKTRSDRLKRNPEEEYKRAVEAADKEKLDQQEILRKAVDKAQLMKVKYVSLPGLY